MATKKDIETVTDAVEAAAETVVEEVKKAAKKAAPKAAEAAEAVEKAVKKTVKSAAETAEKAAEVVSEAAAETVAKAAGTVKEAAAKVEKKAEAAAKPAAKKAAAKGAQADMKKLEGMPRLKKRYKEEIAPALKTKFSYKNPMQIPYLEKVVINMGLGTDKENPKGIEAALKELSTIAGQKAVATRAKKSVANFKVREGMTIGAKVTLRGVRMYQFLDKFMNVALPRVRDFRGVSANAFDGRGNYSVGLKEQLIFPEVEYDKVDKVRGMNIVVVTTAKTDEEARELLKLMGMPFSA